jgi:hypothetical protein
MSRLARAQRPTTIIALRDEREREREREREKEREREREREREKAVNTVSVSERRKSALDNAGALPYWLLGNGTAVAVAFVGATATAAAEAAGAAGAGSVFAARLGVDGDDDDGGLAAAVFGAACLCTTRRTGCAALPLASRSDALRTAEPDGDS